MKRSCVGCRALLLYSSVTGPSCDLGYSNDERKKRIPKAGSYLWEAFPTEKCPKPRTWKEHDNATRKENV
jgi:hypothetical protein